jgi:hypothetical protein
MMGKLFFEKAEISAKAGRGLKLSLKPAFG